jgi:hypothetical protein
MVNSGFIFMVNKVAKIMVKAGLTAPGAH